MVKEYVEIAVDKYNYDVETEYIIDYNIMKRAKRKAAKIQYKKQSNFTVGIKRSKDKLKENILFSNNGFNMYIESKFYVAKKAFKEFDDKECK